MVKKLNFVKEYKTVVRSSHPPLEIVIITYKGTVVKANPLSKLLMLMPTHQFLPKQYIYIYIYIEQNNFVSNSFHVVGQQLDRIEENFEKPTSSIKIEKPLIDFPN